MARLWSNGAELNTTTADVQITAVVSTGGSISSTTVRSGTYSFRGTGTTAAGFFRYTLYSAAADKHIYIRIYFRAAAFPAVNLSKILDVFGTATGTSRASIRINTNGTLELWNDSAQVGSDSSALSLNTWYMVELKYDSTQAAGSDVLEAKIDETSFASSSAQTLGTIQAIAWGLVDAPGVGTAAEFFVDDIAINDSTGSFQNSYPGAGEIIHLRPNAAGDNAAWGDGGSGDHTLIDEVTPDDTTTKITSQNSTTNKTDVNIDATPAAMDTTDTINCVQVGVRFYGQSTANSFVLRIESSAAGTVEESSNIAATAAAYVTNLNAAPRNYQLTLYDLPGASTTAWTKADLDTTQIGVRQSVNGSGGDEIGVSTLWLLVDHTPGGAVTAIKDLIGSGLIAFPR